MVHLVKQIHMI